jgi:glycosyltransferase involved in cell wall biosynthesis
LQREYLGNKKPINMITPLVSVTVTAYQHVNYIKECLDGIIMQKTNFDFEIIVGEDESTDGTRELCIEYAEKYPDKIRLFLRDRKLSQYYENEKLICRF